ncbi:MAG: hypothetical protein AAB971_02020 [Patescibacteria group bacterium]
MNRLLSKRVLSCLLAVPVLAVLATLCLSKTAGATYVASNLIDNVIYTNSGSMNQGQIQSFLAGKGSYLAGYSSYSGRDGGNVSAAQIIAEAASDYAINPQVILATLQKEQSLVTDPSPSSSQINFAMGYGCPDSGSCSHPGFYTQVDYAAWQLRYNYEAINGRAWGGHAASEYPCRAATRYYSPGLYAGTNVTFYNESGAAYRAFVIANAATASLYCYTPHVGPYSETGYSGSYNFVTSFESWWGSTQTNVPFAWSYEGQWAYSDAGRTQLFTSTPTVAPNGKFYARIKARNMGNQTWNQSFMHLGTSHAQDRVSIFADSGWLSNTRPAQLVESSVLPGEVGTFEFAMQAPSTAGTYNEYLNLVAEGHTWLNDLGMFFTINVNTAGSANNSNSSVLNSGESINKGANLLSPDSQTVLALQNDGNLVLYSNFKSVWNTGALGSTVNRLIMQGDGNLVLYNQSNVALWSSQTSGNAGARLVLQTDGNMVVYSSSNVALWATYTTSNPDHLALINTTLPTGRMYPGQSIDTADRRFHLILQGDGNLVLYSPTRALWASGTDGKSIAFLAMQGDGNLVLYDSSGRPIWYSSTSGHGVLRLVVQQDGNLVLYSNLNQPYWHTSTSGAN